MSHIRFYCRPINPGLIQLNPAESHHLTDVRRLAVGESVELFDGAGQIAHATVTQVHPRQVALQIHEVTLLTPPVRPRLIIAASVAKGERFDWLITKCAELGVDHICPVLFARTVKQAQGRHVVQRYENLAIAAAKQCGRVFLPRIDQPAPLKACLAELHNVYPAAQIFFGGLQPQAQSLLTGRISALDGIAVIGPEGGMTEEEELLLEQSGGLRVCLADTILRTETAVLAFAAILAAQRDLAYPQPASVP